ncbi:hypothetical protein [Enterobacter kobei]|uniref:hypothetical protein n=1 Tax=Enterobacter kobei TaxID=208224 RepID=UPI00292C6AE7|nr:hypothetical protein [Enterobacter kobei]MDV1942973.1 hypothetical protein [Enterobacter kobei]
MENPTIAQMLMNPRFMAVLDKCLEEEELITQFERIYEVSRPPKRKHPLEALVDKATGYADSQGLSGGLFLALILLNQPSIIMSSEPEQLR